LSLDVGYHTFNVHLYYGLNSLFVEGTSLGDDNENMKIIPIRVGFVFYIL
jgi:hypothetical protein